MKRVAIVLTILAAFLATTTIQAQEKPAVKKAAKTQMKHEHKKGEKCAKCEGKEKKEQCKMEGKEKKDCCKDSEKCEMGKKDEAKKNEMKKDETKKEEKK